MTVHKKWWLVCDTCGALSHVFNDETKVIDGLAQLGWSRSRFARGRVEDLCPQCKP